ncbi:putative type II restriction endonuclease [uncultured Candidatus Thioglobus sp.]|nr:putative type II restriction endonuclease [uncultured Candidatus Thioglobus sp.]
MLDIKKIEELLIARGAIKKHEVEHSITFDFPMLKQTVYINRDAGENHSGLIIHPRYESHRESLLEISGVGSNEKRYHSSNIGRFPKRRHGGEKKIHFGIPFGFDSEPVFNTFIKKLASISPADIRDEIEEIDDAKVAGEFNELTTTEKQSLEQSRRGQAQYRKRLIDLWKGCSVTACSNTDLLKASHIKPWRDSDNKERLDVYNGFLLTPNLDTVFDGGLITFKDDGAILISSSLDLDTQEKLGILKTFKVQEIQKKHKKYLKYHRKYIFQK